MDINDNSPVWEDTMYRLGSADEYSGIVLETAVSGTFVLEIEASDKDSGSFGLVRYYLVTPTGNGSFIIFDG